MGKKFKKIANIPDKILFSFVKLLLLLPALHLLFPLFALTVHPAVYWPAPGLCWHRPSAALFTSSAALPPSALFASNCGFWRLWHVLPSCIFLTGGMGYHLQGFCQSGISARVSQVSHFVYNQTGG